jgi:hypothetical protein
MGAHACGLQRPGAWSAWLSISFARSARTPDDFYYTLFRTLQGSCGHLLGVFLRAPDWVCVCTLRSSLNHFVPGTCDVHCFSGSPVHAFTHASPAFSSRDLVVTSTQHRICLRRGDGVPKRPTWRRCVTRAAEGARAGAGGLLSTGGGCGEGPAGEGAQLPGGARTAVRAQGAAAQRGRQQLGEPPVASLDKS